MKRAKRGSHLKRRRELFVPPITLNRTSAAPLHRQIHRQIAEAIREGEIPDDARLPSTRMMARLLDVSRNTVLTAYEELAAEGLAQGERGAGMRINGAGRATFRLRHVIRAARYPVRALAVTDPDGNPLYINF